MAEDFQIICSSESKPLSTLKELLEWNPYKQCSDGIDGKQYCLSRLQTHITHPKNKFKTLLCHDMKGGYLEDRYNDGSDNEKAFRFFVWSLVDIFVYFSHNLVTIPPIAWINASHKNGVSILGTFIVEGWTQTNEIISQILNDCKVMETVVLKLVEIAQFFHFEGWLINIECEIDPKSIESLITFVKLLTDTMHDHNPHSMVIWYDSVISPEGSLKWQNEINSSNKSFFDVCDGIFLNYCWKEENLKTSYELSHSLSRNHDVFVGIDVFGRGCFGGGGMNTCLAVKEILKYDLSIAIFASGWTHEVLGDENFTTNEYLFWSSLGIEAHHWPKTLPLCTSFCQGFGMKSFRSGKSISEKCWHNLNLQEIQPTHHKDIQININEAFNGGGSLQLLKNSVLLFRCELTIERCFYSITFKSKSFQKLENSLKYRTNECNESKTFNLFFNESNEEKENDLFVENINDYKRHKEIEKFSKYGIFEATDSWVTQAVILKKRPQLQVIIDSIELNVIDCSENTSPDVLIGQMIFESI